MAYYEHVFIARPDLTEAQVKTMIDDFSKVIKDNKGKVAKEEYWGLKTLAYKIKKNKKAHYVMFGIDGPHDAVAEMEQKQRFDENILRFLTIRVEELETEPSIMMRAKSDDDYDGRPRRKFNDRGPRKDFDAKPSAKKEEKVDDKAEPKAEDKAGEKAKDKGGDE